MISVIAEIAIITEFWSRLSAVGGASPWPGWGVCFRVSAPALKG